MLNMPRHSRGVRKTALPGHSACFSSLHFSQLLQCSLAHVCVCVAKQLLAL